MYYNICPKCRREIKEQDLKFMLGIDRPYRNIWFHRSCFKSLVYPDDFPELLSLTVKLWYNTEYNIKSSRKNKEKW
jgi:hypothetical protein